MECFDRIFYQISIMKITFEKATYSHKQTIFTWLEEPHIKVFWDNSQEHKDDIINFLDGRKTKSNYFDGIFSYWIGSFAGEPYCFIITSEFLPDESLSKLHQDNMSKTGKTYGLDFCIGNKKYLGKGYAANTLEEFTKFFQSEIDVQANKFFIDPDDNNPKAKHVYEKAGFREVGEFKSDRKYWEFDGDKQYLMVKELAPFVQIMRATISDYQLIQNMARFYVYDMSRCCGVGDKGWAIPKDGLYEAFDFKNYFEDASRKAFMVKVNEELAGFVLINKEVKSPSSEWNMGEFFIIARFQGKGIGGRVAKEIWNLHPGNWEVSVIPENKSALEFWRKNISNFTNNNFKENIIIVDYDEYQGNRYLLSFDAN